MGQYFSKSFCTAIWIFMYMHICLQMVYINLFINTLTAMGMHTRLLSKRRVYILVYTVAMPYGAVCILL